MLWLQCFRGEKSTGCFRRMLNAAELVSQCGISKSPDCSSVQLKRLSKALLQSHTSFQSPCSPPSQSNTPMTLLNNKTSKAALRSNPTKISPVLQQPRAAFRGERGLRAQGKGLQSTCSKKRDFSFQQRKVSQAHK